MSQHNDIIRLHHMLDHAKKASQIADCRDQDELIEDQIKCLALIRLLEIIGEAASHVSDDFQSKYPDIPWSRIVGLRNRLIHGYDAVDMDILWNVLKEDVPKLIEALEAIDKLKQE